METIEINMVKGRLDVGGQLDQGNKRVYESAGAIWNGMHDLDKQRHRKAFW